MPEQSVHAKSSRTADGVALRRTFTNIPLCKEIYEIFERVNGPTSSEDREREQLSGLIPFFEARYLLTDRLWSQSGINQIFEHAAGLTPRSLLYGANKPSARCVEFDLPEKLELKKRIVRGLVDHGHITEPTNVWFESGNVTDIVALATAARHFRNEPIVIVNEGLDRYLSQFERTLKLSHNHRLLKHYGGVNITPDMATKTGMATIRKMRDVQKALGGREAALEKELGFNMNEHYHEGIGDARLFHEAQGFEVEEHCLTEVLDELASPKILNLNISAVEEMLSYLYAFVLRPI